MMVDNIIEALDAGDKCWITFKSMTSDTKYTRLYEGSCYPSNGDKMLVVNVETKELEDIEKKTIIEWQRSSTLVKNNS